MRSRAPAPRRATKPRRRSNPSTANCWESRAGSWDRPRRFSSEIVASRVKRSSDLLKQAALEGLRREIDEVMATVKKVVHQTHARVFDGDTQVEAGSERTEFGRMVKIHQAENQILIDFEVYDRKPSDSDLLIPSIEAHQTLMGRTPHLVAADAGSTPRRM
jgi:transposase, IS5 family